MERYCELANKTTQQLYKVSTPCIDDHHFKVFESRISAGAEENARKKATGIPDAETIASWSYGLEGHAKKCVEIYSNLRIKQLSNYTKLQRHAWMIISSKKKKMDQLETCPQFAPYLARVGRLDIWWSVNKRLARLISYIHHTSDYRQYCCAGNTAQHCRLGLFQDSDFAGDLEFEDSKSTSGGLLCIFGSQTFVPISWMCKKQTSVSHSSTES